MELGIYDVIKGIVMTPKSLLARKNLGKITFSVNLLTNKIQIRNAVEKIWNVKVRDVRIVKLHGKKKRIQRREYRKSDTKKAIITLKEGYTIDLPDQFESMGLSQNGSSASAGEN